MSQQDEVMTRFEELMAQKRSIKLFNTYRGIPVTHPAEILAVQQGCVVVKVHEYQAVCLTLEGVTYVENDALPEVFQARALKVDILRQEAVLTEFVGSGHSIGKRADMRVQPREPIDVEVQDDVHRIPGKLADISMKGLGVFTFAAYIYGEQSFQEHADVTVQVRMPNASQPFDMAGKIISLAQTEGSLLNRLGIVIVPQPLTEPVLKQYIAQRANEIIRELRTIYEALVKEHQEDQA